MSQGKPRRGSPLVPMVLSLILIVIGLYALQLGIEALSNSDLPYAVLLLSVVVFCFGFVTFSIMRVRRGFSITWLPPNKVLSIVTCTKCSFKQIKNFAVGEYIFKTLGKCTQCGNETLYINGIYADDVKKR